MDMNRFSPTVYRRKCFLINCAYFVVIAAIVLLVLRYAFNALLPFVIAAICAAILRPVLRFLNEKLRLPRKPTGVVLTILLYLLIALAAVIVVDRVLEAGVAFLTSLPALWNNTLMPALMRLSDTLTAKLAEMNFEVDFSLREMITSFGSTITSLSSRLVGMAGNFAFSLPSLLISVIICIVSTLFMLFDWDKITGFIYLQLNSRNSDLAQNVSKQSGSTIKQFILSYGLILLVTFSELSIGFLIIGFKSPFLIAALISIFDILPVVGCGGILIPWSLISFIIGNTSNGIGIALLYVVITIVRNIVEPRIVGKQVGLHPLVTLMSMVIGSSLMGGIGLFALPITLAVINKMNKEGVIKLYKTASQAEKEKAEAESKPEPEKEDEKTTEKKAG